MPDASQSVIVPSSDFNAEQWKPVVGFPGYEVSSHGRVRSFWSVGKNSRIVKDWKLRALVKFGVYLSLILRKNKKKILCRAHVLVLEAFIGPRPEGCYGCHGPAGCLVNRVDNLSWGTPTENFEDMARDGTMIHGEKSYNAVLTEEQVQAIRKRIQNGDPFREIANEFGITDAYVSGINRGEKWGRLPLEFDPKTFPIRKTRGGINIESLSSDPRMVLQRMQRAKKRAGQKQVPLVPSSSDPKSYHLGEGNAVVIVPN